MRERAVYYCRVSTEEENQLASMARQKEEAQQAIRDNDTVSYGVQADE